MITCKLCNEKMESQFTEYGLIIQICKNHPFNELREIGLNDLEICFVYQLYNLAYNGEKIIQEKENKNLIGIKRLMDKEKKIIDKMNQDILEEHIIVQNIMILMEKKNNILNSIKELKKEYKKIDDSVNELLNKNSILSDSIKKQTKKHKEINLKIKDEFLETEIRRKQLELEKDNIMQKGIKSIKDKQNGIKKNQEKKIREAVRKEINRAIKTSKPNFYSSFLGCSIEELKFYLESRFYNHPVYNYKMTWENKGLGGWHIDHIKPLILFDLMTEDGLSKALHYTNLQPLWAEDNIKKGSH